MPAKKAKPKRYTTLKKGQLSHRLIGVHDESPCWISGRDVLGFPFRVPIVGVRITMNDEGKSDVVEVLT